MGFFFVWAAAAFLGSIGLFVGSLFTSHSRVLGLELVGAVICFIGVAAFSSLILMLDSQPGAGILLLTVLPSLASLAISIRIGRRASLAEQVETAGSGRQSA